MKFTQIGDNMIPNGFLTEHDYAVWKADIRVRIKRSMHRGLFDTAPEVIARYLGMNEYQIFYARTITKFIKVVEEVPRDEQCDEKWLDGAPELNPWWEIFERQEEEGWWVGQMRLPL